MYKYIANLRTKPDHHKKRVALAGAFAITAMMFIAWVSVILPSNASEIIADNQSQVAQTTQVSGSQSSTPFQDLKASVSTAFGSLKGIFEKKANDFNFQDEYGKMKDQVQSGEIKLAPDTTTDTTN